MTKHNKTIDPPRRIWARACALALIAAMLLTGAYAGGAVTLAEAAEPRAIGTVDTVSTKEKIHINLFDYDGQKANELYQNAKPGGYDDVFESDQYLNRFTFQDSDSGINNSNTLSSTSWNQWTGQTTVSGGALRGNGVYQGILAPQMRNGYPVLSAKTTQPYTLTNGHEPVDVQQYDGNTSFSQLFDPANVNQQGAMVEAITNADKLFQQDQDGYYFYDSRTNFAQINKNTKEFTVYTAANEKFNNEPSCPKFLPFNSFNTNTGLISGNKNYHFGMSVDFTFLQPKDGLINEKDMIFTFTGDDDVWLYIDGILALDMGGIHNPHTGKINFKTGQVTIDNVYTPSSPSTMHPFDGNLYEIMRAAGADEAYLKENFIENSDGEKVFKDYTTHTFNYYYLERGAGGSNCEIKFNLPAIPNDTIYVQKEIRNTNIPDFSDARFQFKVEVKDQDQNGQPTGNYLPYTGEYTVYSGQIGQGKPVREDKTNDGTFKLQHGQYAELKGENGHIPIKATTQYRVSEIGVHTDQYEIASNTSVSEIEDAQGNVIGKETQGLIVNQEPVVTFLNDLMVKNAHSLEITKEMATGQSSAGSFQIQITLGGKLYQKAPYYLKKSDGSINQQPNLTDENGCLFISPGDTICIMSVPWGTSFKIEEVKLNNSYKSPSYRIDGEAASSEAAQGSIPTEVTASKKTTVTITNTLKTGGFTIKKVGEENAPLTGAGFELREAIANWDDTWSDQENGQVYYPNDISGSLTGVDGIAAFQNIPFGTYLLYETKAPAGYQLPTAPIRVTVSAKNVTLTINGEQVTVPAPTGEAETGREVPIPNKEKDQLPIAGGAGTLWFTCGGLALTGAAALLYGRQRRSKGKHE